MGQPPRLRLILATALTILCQSPAVLAWQTPGEKEAAEARALVAQGNCKGALAAFDQAIKTRQEDAGLRRDRGRCHERLGNDRPAIEDYKSYLALAASDAPDRAAVTERLERLEALVSPDPEEGAKPKNLEDPFAEEPAEAEPEPVEVTGLHFGPHGGWRTWSKVLADPTVSIGAEVGYRYEEFAHVDLRATYLSTGTTSTRVTGWGLSAAHTWRVGLDEASIYQLWMGAGLGYELHTTHLKTTQDYLFVRATPAFAWRLGPGLNLILGAEFGLGLFESDSVTIPGADDESASRKLAMYYGVVAGLLFDMSSGGSSSSKPPASNEAGEDKEDEIDEDTELQPVDDQQVW